MNDGWLMMLSFFGQTYPYDAVNPLQMKSSDIVFKSVECLRVIFILTHG